MLNYFSSIRIRLLLLVTLALIPVLGLMLYNFQEEKKQAIIEKKDNALHFARLAAKDQDFLFEGARQLLSVLAKLPSIENLDPKECNQFLADLLTHFPIYENLGVVNQNGDLICSALPITQNLNFGDRSWFHLAIQTRSFVSGEYIIARISQRPILTNALPVFDQMDKLSSVLFAGIDLNWIDKFVADANLPKGSTLSVIDQNGIILTHYPDAELWRGKSLSPTDMEVLDLQGEGVYEGEGLDGVSRLFGFTKLCCMPWSSIYVKIGIPMEIALVDAKKSLYLNLSIFVIVILLSFIISREGANLFILRPLNSILKTIKRFDSGDYSARVGRTSGGSELDSVAHSFDEMAATVESRDIERDHTEEILRLQTARAQSVSTIAARLNSHLDIQHVLDIVCGEITQALQIVAASVSLFNDSSNNLYCVSHCGLPEDFCEVIESLCLNDFIPKFQLGEEIIITCNQTTSQLNSSSYLHDLGVSAITCNPLVHEAILIGILCVFTQNDNFSLGENELSFLRAVSDQSAQAIVNARLYRTIQKEQQSRAALLEKTISAQEDERMRIARELHDQTSQDLTTLMLNLDTCGLSLTSSDPMPKEYLANAKSILNSVLSNIHQLINDLRPALLDELGLASAIQWYGDKRLKNKNILFIFHCDQTETRLPPSIEITLFRISQEAITNILKHAKATNVKINLNVASQNVNLTIEDDGIGFQKSADISDQTLSGGLGLSGIQERISTLGGELDIISKPGEGTLIKVKVPLQKGDHVIV